MFKKSKKKLEEKNSGPLPNGLLERQTSQRSTETSYSYSVTEKRYSQISSSSSGSISNITNLQISEPRALFTNSLPSSNNQYALDAVPFQTPKSNGYVSPFNRRLTPLNNSVRAPPSVTTASTSMLLSSPFNRNERNYSSERGLPNTTNSGISRAPAPRSSYERSGLSASAVPEYVTNGPKRSKVLIINNVNFPNPLRDRRGAEADEKQLTAMFKKFKFDVETNRNLKQKEILKKVQQFRTTKSLKNYDMCFVIIMSHGGNSNIRGGYTEIEGIDEKGICTEDIMDEFTVENCPAMGGKPKIFIFQCCRGDKDDKTSTDASPFTKLVKNKADVLIAYSTLPGYVSRRDPQTGSHYIQTICDVFQKNAAAHHIEDMLKIVDSEMTKTYPIYKQTSTYENRGFKKCYLNPK